MPNLSQEKNWKQQKYKMNSTKNECFKIRTFNHCYRAIYFSFSKLSMLQLVFWVSSRSSPKTVIILRTGHVDTWYTCHWSYENVFFIYIINIASSLNTHSTVKSYSFGSFYIEWVYFWFCTLEFDKVK